MSSITIHDIDEHLSERLADEARRRRTSKNSLIKAILAEHVGLPVGGSYADDYGEFVGLWTAAERAEFERSQVSNAAVDPSDWQ